MLHEAVSRSPSLMTRLNAATAAIRDDRELLVGKVSWLDYRLYLVRMYGFHAPAEQALAAQRSLTSVVGDAGLRNHKAALLAHDLIALGADRRDLLQAPRMVFASSLELPEALGWMYVVESMTLRNRQVSQRLARHLPGEIQRASAYLRCYGDEVETRWHELGRALDGHAQCAVHACDRVIDAARDGLLQLRRWLGPVLQPRTTRRHA